MLQIRALNVFLITVIVSVSAKLFSPADNSAVGSSVSEQFPETSVANDNICNNHEKNVAFDVILFDNNSPLQHEGVKRVSRRHAPRNKKKDYKDRPRPDQRSLLIVFDATGSMHDDLEQLRAGAQEIVNELSAREDNPIYNYVLVVYRDPTVEPPFDTKNPDELLSKLKHIQTVGGGDCPEYALSGLKIALEFALPNSLAYVFSDATAKDLGYYEQVLGLIQKKQVALNFLLTGNCDDPNTPGYQVYLKLSRASNGQVYDMNKSNVKDVLLAIRHTVNYNYASLKSVDAESAGTTNTKLNIDKSISELSVSLSGKNPRLTIKDPRNETIRSDDELLLTNLRLVKIKDPVDGLWNVESEADSSHSIRLGAISEMKFEFGFSTDEPKKQTETSFQPLDKHKNILSIFVSDPTLIKNLSEVTIVLIPSNAFESSHQFKISLRKVEEQIYSTKAFELPRQMFKIQLNGIDASGNQIERLISTGLHSSQGSAPETTIQVNQKEINEFEKLLLKCEVKSHTPVNISWVFNGKTLAQMSSNQSNDLELVIKSVVNSNAGTYFCDTINGFGATRKEISIKVLSAPKIMIVPDKLTVVENSTGRLDCVVETSDDDFTISWIDHQGNVLQNIFSNSYEFVASRNHHNKPIRCQVSSGDFFITNSSQISVEYSPKFTEATNNHLKITHGSSFKLSCETDANPSGQILWHFTAKGAREPKLNLNHREASFNIERMSETNQGRYECLVENIHGKDSKIFDVVDYPKGPPKILMEKDVIIVNETDSFDLVCESFNSLPITNSSWYNENSNNYERFITKDERNDNFKSVLRITDIDESDNGSFECYLENPAGHDKISFELLVQTQPKIDAIIMKLNDHENEIESDINVLEGEDVQFDCVVDGYPGPEVKWFKDQEEIIRSNETILGFERVSEDEAGTYQCFVKNILGMASKGFNLQVNVPPKVKSSKDLIKVLETEKVSLQCDIGGSSPLRITWSVNGKAPNERFQISNENKVLEFEAHLTDSGIYSCTGVNQFGSVSINSTVLVMGPPKILQPNDETAKGRFGRSLELNCDATGFPQPRVSWTKDDKLLLIGRVMHIEQLTMYHSGAYVCQAENDVGNSQKVFFVTVTEAPKIMAPLHNITLFTNQTRNVHCDAKGSPKPETYWTYDGVKIKGGNDLTLKSLMHSGIYTCVAESSEGKDESSFYFDAINKPSFVADFEELKKEIKVREGDGLELLCPFDNFNEIHWKFNNKVMFSSQKDSIDNKLRLDKIDRNVNGEWVCFVSNIAGNNSFSFNVTVLASPVIHASWNLNNRVSEFLVTESDIDEKIFKMGETLQLNCTAQGSPKPKVLWKKAIDVIAEGETLIIDNLQFHHSDIYTCSAENDQGVVKKFFKVDVVSPPFIDDNDIQRSFQKAIGDSVLLKCKMIGNPIPNIFWFKNNVLLDDESDSYLEIKQLSLNDDGTYKCIAKNPWGRESIDFHVSIMEKATIVKAEEIQKITRNENSMKLLCHVRGNPLPVVSWISNGHILSTTSKLNVEKIFSTVQESVLYFNGFGNTITYLDPFQLKLSKEKFYSQLTKLSESSLKLEVIFRDRDAKAAGSYQCYAYNALGKDDKTVDVTVNEKPFMNEKQMSQLYENEVLEGLPLLLSCLISGQPTPSISWFKGSAQIHENDTIKILSSSRFLSIAETSSWDSGNYSCKGVNDIGEKIINFKVSVLSPPKFIGYSVVPSSISNRFHNDKLKVEHKNDGKSQVKVMKGDEVALDCFSEGSPNPNIHWLKIDFYDPSKNELLEENDNILIIRSIKESNNFMCYLNNTVGNIHKMFQVIVQFSPSFVDDSKIEHHLAVKLHHGVNLDCEVEGSPEPKIKWIFNGTEIATSDKEFYFSNDNQILRILDSKKSHQGKFLCVAENSFGKLERVFYVSVEVPIQWSSFGPWTTCSVSCGSGGIQYRTRVCLLSNGHPATADDYKCVGENVETRKCNRLSCPVNGGWGKYGKWTKCPKCADEKTQELPLFSKRVRKCDSPIPSNGGLECSGSDIEEVECNVSYCPINGGWSEWSSWSSCAKTCGVSHRMRKRFCNNPLPMHNGTYCDGENVEYEDCKFPPCLNHKLRKSFDDDLDELEELSNETRDKYGEVAEFEIKDQDGVARNFQFMNHREIEFTPPLSHTDAKLPKIKVTLDTYKPISEETYNRHVNQMNLSESDDSDDTESTSSDLESTEIDQAPKKCVKGFYFNSVSKQCEDINECQSQVHPHNCSIGEKCVNALGSFRCERTTRRSRH